MKSSIHEDYDVQMKKRILIICDLFPPDILGGYELRCEEACNWLHQKGYLIEVLTTKSSFHGNVHPFPIHRLLTKYGLGKTPPTWSFPKRMYLAIKDNLIFKRLLKNYKPDLIYVWNCTGISRSLIPYIFSSKIRKLVDVSSSWLLKVYTQHGPVYRVLENNSQKTSHTLVVSAFRKIIPIISINTVKEKFLIDFTNVMGYFTSDWNKRAHVNTIKQCESFETIYTGVNLSEFPYQQKRPLLSDIKLLFVGRIQEEKGFNLLLDQLNFAQKKISKKIILMTAGEFLNEEERKETLDLIERLGLSKSVIFLGKIERNKLHNFYNETDFVVFPSLTQEAFSRVPLESMACGTPCISTDNPGSKELFERKAPLIMLERSSAGLQESLEPFLLDSSKFQEISQAGRLFVEQSFTFDHFMEKVQGKFLFN